MNWRDTARPSRFFMFDGKVLFLLIFTFLPFATWKIPIAFVGMGIFYFAEYKGLNFDSTLRLIRAWFAGKQRPPVSETRLPMPIDYQRPYDT